MSITVTLSDLQVRQYILSLELSIKEQESDILSRQRKLDEDRTLLTNLRATLETNIIAKHVITETSVGEPYDFNWPVTRKAEYVLEQALRPLSAKEICTILYTIDPNIKGDKDERGFNTVLSASLGNYVKFGNTFGRVHEEGVYRYGLIDWFTDSGELKDEYKN